MTKMGRPPKVSPRTQAVLIRLTPAERRLLVERAREAKLNVSAYLRRQALQ